MASSVKGQTEVAGSFRLDQSVTNVRSNCILDKSVMKQLPSKSHGDGAGGDLCESGGEDEG